MKQLSRGVKAEGVVGVEEQFTEVIEQPAGEERRERLVRGVGAAGRQAEGKGL